MKKKFYILTTLIIAFTSNLCLAEKYFCDGEYMGLFDPNKNIDDSCERIKKYPYQYERCIQAEQPFIEMRKSQEKAYKDGKCTLAEEITAKYRTAKCIAHYSEEKKTYQMSSIDVSKDDDMKECFKILEEELKEIFPEIKGRKRF